MEFLLRKTSFLAIASLIIASFLFGNFVLSKGIEISGKDVERIKAGLEVIQLFANIAIGDEKVKTALNTGVKGGKAGTDITYGLLVLTAMNEMDLIDMVVSQRYKQEATAYFDQIIDERIGLTSYWKGVGYDLPRVVKGNVNSPMVGLTLNSFSITDKVVSIFIAFNVIRQEKIYDGLWYYFSLRRENKESHQIAWEDAKILMGWAVNARIEETGAFIKGKKSGEENISQLESQFATLWDKWGPYTDRFGVTKAAKKQFNEEIGQLVVEAVGQQALAEKNKEPSLFEKIFGYLGDKAYEIFTGAWDTIKSVVSQVNPFGGAEVGQTTLEVAPQSEAEKAEIGQGSNLGTAEDEEILQDLGQEQDFDESFEGGIGGPELPTLAELADLQRQIDEAARMVEALSRQVLALVATQEKKDDEVKDEEELDEWEERKDSEKEIALNLCPVNINTGSAKDLQAITGIGPVLAQRIIEARSFASLSELETKVKGIGAITLQKIIAQGCAYAAGFIASGGGGGGVSAQTVPPATDSSPSYSKILISEVQIEGEKKSHDFIELYNPNSNSVDIGKWQLKKKNKEGKKSSLGILSAGSIVPSNSYFLWAGGMDENYPDLIQADVSFKSYYLTEDNSIALLSPDDTIISALAWGSSTNPFVEETPFPESPGKNQSLGRIWDEEAGGYKNTGNNSIDFEIQTPTPKAQNQSPEQEEEQESEPAQNLLANEFFEEWDSEVPANWAWATNTLKRIGQDNTDPLRGNYNVWLKPIGSLNTLQQTASSTLNTEYYGEIWAKGTDKVRARVGIIGPGSSYGSYTELENDEWTKITHSRVIGDVEEATMAISVLESEEEDRPRIYIGAAWLGLTPPPDWWLQGLPPNKVEQFALDSQNSYSNRVRLTWATSTDPDTASEDLSYKIYYSKEGELTDDNLENASTTITTQATTTVSSLDFNSAYYFGIKAFDPENNSSTIATTTPYKTATLRVIAGGFPANINTAEFANNGRKLARTSNDDLYSVYSRSASAHKVFLAKSTDNGLTWTEIEINSDEDQLNPSIAIDSENNLHIAWQGKVGTSTKYQIRYAKYDGSSFVGETDFTADEDQDQEIPVATIDSQGKVHLAWIGRSTLGDNLYYVNNMSGAWGSIKTVKAGEYHSTYGKGLLNQFSLALDNQDTLHFVWFEKPPADAAKLRYRKVDFKLDSESWSKFEDLAVVDLLDYSSIVIDSQNNVHIIWHRAPFQSSPSRIEYFKYSNGGWIDELLNEDSNYFVIASPSISTDHSDNIYVVWKRHNLKPLYQIEYRDGSWQDIKELIPPFEWQGFPNLLWSMNNQPKTGYAFVFYEGEELKFYGSEDLTWE